MTKADFLAAGTYLPTDRYTFLLSGAEWANIKVTSNIGLLGNTVQFTQMDTQQSWTVSISDIIGVCLTGTNVPAGAIK